MTTRVEIINDFLAINVKPGSTIQDVVEASGSALPFGCRDGQCRSCRLLNLRISRLTKNSRILRVVMPMRFLKI